MVTRVNNRMIDGTAFNVIDYGAVGDGVADDTAAINAAINDVPEVGGKILFPEGRYKITSTISTTKSNLSLEGLGGQGGQDGRAACELVADGAFIMMDIGTPSSANWRGLTLKNLGFNGNGIATTGLRIVRTNSWTLENYYAYDMPTGVGLQLDGGGDSTQYGVMINPRITSCRYGIRKTDNVTDITIVGGRLYGAVPFLTSSTGIEEVEGSTGRWNILGLGINNFQRGMVLTGMRNSFIRCTMEQSPAQIGQGTAIRFDGPTVNTPDEGWRNKLFCHLVGWSVGVQVGEHVRFLSNNCTYSQVNFQETFPSGIPIGYVANSMASDVAAGGERRGMKYSFQAQSSQNRSVGFNNIPTEFGTTFENGIEHDTGSGIIITDDATEQTGGYIGTNSSNGIVVWGFGVKGNAIGPQATSNDGAFLYLVNGTIYYHKFSGVAIGATIDLVSTRQGELAVV